MHKWIYYAMSLVRVVTGFRRPIRVLTILLGPRLRRPTRVSLRAGPEFLVRSKMDVWCLKETWLDRFYERQVGPIGLDWRIIDIGAGIGDFTVLAAQAALLGTVLAFEPLPDSYRMLADNLARNACSNVHAEAVAVGGHGGSLSIGAASGDPLQTTADASRRGSEVVPVPCVALEEVITRLFPEACDLAKMDCEGAEFDIILASPASALQKIQRFVLEYHDWPPHDHLMLSDRLTSLGYCVRTTPNAVHGETGYLYAWKGDLPHARRHPKLTLHPPR